MFLARKINRAKWDPQTSVEDGEIAADAVTADLRTEGNTLSFWMCHDVDEASLNDVVLALAAGSDRIDKFDIAWLAKQRAEDEGLALANTDGHTPVLRLVKRHADIERLDLVRLGKVAKLIKSCVTIGDCKRVTKAEVSRILVAAVKAGDLAIDAVNEKLRPTLDRAIKMAGSHAAE